MRNAFADAIYNIALNDPNVILLSGDIGNKLFDNFKLKIPRQFYNCGIAEANMISMAAGLASCGLRPVCYTITPFITTRCLEQIKIDVCYHNVPVTIVGTGSGLAYASLGSTHHSFEDLSCLRVLPNIIILTPLDPLELRFALNWVLTQNYPCYIRIGKKGEPIINQNIQSFQAGCWQKFRSGKKATLLCCGTIVYEALQIAEVLDKKGIDITIWGASSVKPLDYNALNTLPSAPVITIEEHSIYGGFGSAVSEYLTENGFSYRIIRLGIPDQFLHECESQKEARIYCKIDSNSILKKIIEIIT